MLHALMPASRVSALVETRANLDDFIRLERAIVERIGKLVQQRTAQSSMNDRAAVRMRTDQIDSASKIAKKVLTQLWPSCFVPRISLGDVAIGQRGEADLPTHRL